LKIAISKMKKRNSTELNQASIQNNRKELTFQEILFIRVLNLGILAIRAYEIQNSKREVGLILPSIEQNRQTLILIIQKKI